VNLVDYSAARRYLRSSRSLPHHISSLSVLNLGVIATGVLQIAPGRTFVLIRQSKVECAGHGTRRRAFQDRCLATYEDTARRRQHRSSEAF
jgi:hypothetical protein